MWLEEFGPLIRQVCPSRLPDLLPTFSPHDALDSREPGAIRGRPHALHPRDSDQVPIGRTEPPVIELYRHGDLARLGIAYRRTVPPT